MVKILGANHGSRVCQEQDTTVQQLWTVVLVRYMYIGIVRLCVVVTTKGRDLSPGWRPGDHWRPLATNWRPTGDLLATWRHGDLATWRPTGDLLATYWRPTGDLLATTGNAALCSCTGDRWRPLATWRPGDLATIGDYWRPGDLATAGDRWQLLVTFATHSNSVPYGASRILDGHLLLVCTCIANEHIV